MGNSSAGRRGTPKRSRMVLLYSTRFRRRATTRPGFPAEYPAAVSKLSTQAVTAAMSSLGGAGSPGGGILPVMSLSRTLSQISGDLEAEAASENACRFRFAEFSFSLWQRSQFLTRNGLTRESKV